MLNHTGTQRIETQRLILRPMEMRDAADIFEYTGRDETTEFLYMPTHKSQDETAEYVNGWIKRYQNKDFYHWCMEDKASGKTIGNVMLLVVSERDLVGEVAYYMNKSFGGRGLMSEAIRGVLEYGFNVVGFNRLESGNATENPASGKVARNAGMKHEGTQRQKYRNRTGWHDSDMWGMLKSDL